MKLDNVIAVRPTKTVYRDGNTTIKLFNPSFTVSSVLNEALNLARVGEAASLNIPRLHEVTKIGDSWAIVYDFIEGKSLADLMEEEPDKRDYYMDRFVDLQMQVHRQTVPLLTKLKDKMNRKIAESDLDATTRYDLHTRLEGMPKHVKLCHGDYTPSNVILDPKGELYILDWAHATQGNASADAARTYLRFCLDKQMEMAEEYLDLFCQKSGTDKRYVQKWMPIVAASQSVKNNMDEREFLFNWVNVVEFQ